MHSIWIEIPVTDLARAKAFYETVFRYAPTEILSGDGRRITVIEGQPTVSLNQTPGFVPTDRGTVPYYHLEEPIADALARVTAAGGRIVEPATARGEHGVFGLVHDTEGNPLYLHASG